MVGWLDAHFFLPCYDLPCEFPFFPDSMQWTQTWWDPSLGGTKICIYFDGSFVAGQSNAQSGAGIAAFVFTNDRWAFAEALSTGLDAGFRSYQAEAAAGVVALKFSFDLLKLIRLVNPVGHVDLTFCYDSLTAGMQAAGHWHAISDPQLGHLLRSLHKCVEQRFQVVLNFQHVKAHSGEPGNELVDTCPSSRQLISTS